MGIEHTLFEDILRRIINELSLEELPEPVPFFSCAGFFGRVPDMAVVRVYRGEKIERLVHVQLNSRLLGLTSNMLYAFTPAESVLPHFTLDVVKRGGTYGLHCDLIPRTSVGTMQPAYFGDVYLPLLSLYLKTDNLPGLKRCRLRDQQRELMSPQLLCYMASREDKYAQLEGPVAAYLEQWFKLLDTGVKYDHAGLAPGASVENDRLHRSLIFSPSIDPVWMLVALLVGRKNEAKIRACLTEPLSVAT
ncbi:MAG: hypothetical protein SFV17_03290 [Candidatus Obscuribacter sp.]|nr:hypothetical protein [Candidatus Obscuribacter sp.]